MYNKMTVKSHIKFSVFVMLLINNVVNTEDYEQEDDDNITSVSIDSDSKETYNVSSKEKPHKQVYSENKYDVTDSTINSTSTTNKPINVYNNMENASKPSVFRDIPFKKSLYSFSFSVSIQKKGSHYTTGALLDKNWILTVAEPYFNVRETIKLFKVRLGSVHCKKGGLLIPLKGIEIHPHYDYKQPSFDIALLKVAQPVEFSDIVRPIKLSTVKGRIVRATFLATYWPRLIVKGAVLPHSAEERVKKNSMRISTQQLIPWDKCSQLLHVVNQSLDGTSLCLEPITSHHTPCMPDPGAPIVADDSVWGVTSGWTSESCSTHPHPTIFTSTSLTAVRSWVVSIINGLPRDIYL